MSTSSETKSPKTSLSPQSSSNSSSSGDGIADGTTNLQVGAAQATVIGDESCGYEQPNLQPQQSIRSETADNGRSHNMAEATVPHGSGATLNSLVIGTLPYNYSFRLHTLPPDDAYSMTAFTALDLFCGHDVVEQQKERRPHHTPCAGAESNVNMDGDMSTTLMFHEDENTPPPTTTINQEDDVLPGVGGTSPQHREESSTPFHSAAPAVCKNSPFPEHSHDLVSRPSPSLQPNLPTSDEHQGKVVASQICHIDRKKVINSVRDHKEDDNVVLQAIAVSDGPKLHLTVHPYGLGDDRVEAVSLHVKVHIPPQCKPTSQKTYQLLITVTNEDETKIVPPLRPQYFNSTSQELQVRLLPYPELLQSKSDKLHLTFQVESIDYGQRFKRSPTSRPITIPNKSPSIKQD